MRHLRRARRSSTCDRNPYGVCQPQPSSRRSGAGRREGTSGAWTAGGADAPADRGRDHRRARADIRGRAVHRWGTPHPRPGDDVDARAAPAEGRWPLPGHRWAVRYRPRVGTGDRDERKRRHACIAESLGARRGAPGGDRIRPIERCARRRDGGRRDRRNTSCGSLPFARPIRRCHSRRRRVGRCHGRIDGPRAVATRIDTEGRRRDKPRQPDAGTRSRVLRALLVGGGADGEPRTGELRRGQRGAGSARVRTPGARGPCALDQLGAVGRYGHGGQPAHPSGDGGARRRVDHERRGARRVHARVIGRRGAGRCHRAGHPAPARGATEPATDRGPDTRRATRARRGTSEGPERTRRDRIRANNRIGGLGRHDRRHPDRRDRRSASAAGGARGSVGQLHGHGVRLANGDPRATRAGEAGVGEARCHADVRVSERRGAVGVFGGEPPTGVCNRR